MERTPHPEEPAEGAPDVDGTGTDGSTGPDSASHSGDPDRIPEHNSAPDGYAAQDSTSDGSTGGAIQGDSSDGGTGGAIQGDANPERRTSLGGDENTEGQLDADNEVEEDSLKTLDPDDPPA